MAPEQVLGLAVTPQADIHAMGVVLHELFTGSLPYSPAADADPAVLRSEIVAGTRNLAESLPVPVQAICSRALQVEPTRSGQCRGIRPGTPGLPERQDWPGQADGDGGNAGPSGARGGVHPAKTGGLRLSQPSGGSNQAHGRGLAGKNQGTGSSSPDR
jgi:hypothetical protein